MVRNRWVRRAALIGLMVLPIIVAGCGLVKEDDNAAIDPPQVDYELEASTDQPVLANDVDTKSDKSSTVTLYFKDAESYVVPISMKLPASEGIAKEALQYMVDDGPQTSMLPEGFTSLIPKGTSVLGLDINKDGIATVDFSEQFTNYNIQDERKILEAITWTLTGFPTVKSVKLRVKGKILTEMPMDATPLDEPLSRSMGINLERVESVNPAIASVVTVYFVNHTGDDYKYYVPITRLVPRTDNSVLATVEQLIHGPISSSSLEPVFSPNTEVLDAGDHDGIITVNFTDELFKNGDKAAEDAMRAVMLSLTGQNEISKVQIKVNGTKAKSVSMPSHLNPLAS